MTNILFIMIIIASTFRGLASSASQRRYHVAWSPCLPAVASACSFDRKVMDSVDNFIFVLITFSTLRFVYYLVP